MNKIKQTLNRIRILGGFGLILILAMTILGVAIYQLTMIKNQVDEIQVDGYKSFLLLELEYYFIETELTERLYVLYQDEAYLDNFEYSDSELEYNIANYLYTVLTNEIFKGSAELLGEFFEENIDEIESFEVLEELNESWIQIRKNSNNIVTSVDSGEMTIEKLNQIILEENELDELLRNMVFESEIVKRIAVEKGVNLVERSSLIVIGGMILFPFLAIWAYFIASRLTNPLLGITNAIMAAGGSHYNSDMLEETIHRPDGIGELSQAVDAMVAAAEERENHLKAELLELTAELREDRKHKLTRSPVKKSDS